MRRSLVFCKCFVLTVIVLAFFTASSALAQSDQSDYYRGLDLYHAGDYAGAIKAFEAQLQKTPDHKSATQWLNLSQKRAAQRKMGESPRGHYAGGSSGMPLRQRPAPTPAPSPPPAPKVAKPQPVLPPAPKVAKPQPTPPLPKTPPVVAQAPASKPPKGGAEDDYEKGISLYLNGQYKASLEAFNRYLEANPGHMATQQWISLVKALVPSAGAAKAPVKSLPAVEEKPRPVPRQTQVVSETKPAPPPRRKLREVTVPPPPSSAIATEKGLTKQIEKLKIQNARLRNELAESEEVASRAIEQTKKALALPPVSYDQFEKETQQLKADQSELTSKLRRVEKTLDEKEQLLAKAIAKNKDQEKEIKSLERDLQRARSQKGPLRRGTGQLSMSQRKLTETQRKLESMEQKYRRSEEARRTSERKVASINRDKESLQREIKDLQRDIRRLQDSPRIKSAEDTLKKTQQTLSETERALAEVTLQYQASEETRLSAERNLVEVLQREQDSLVKIQNLSARMAEDQEARNTASKAQALLEESRSQGLKLVTQLQNERQKREQLETQIAALARKDAQNRALIQKLRQQLENASTQLDELRNIFERVDSRH